MLMFDLPVSNKEQRRIYNKFRGKLIKSGYMQMQESLYVKLLRSTEYEKNEIEDVRRFSPVEGNVKALGMTLLAFKEMVTITGNDFNFEVFSDDVVYL